MKPWTERTREEANLLNPPFCCAVLTSACIGFKEKSGKPLPFVLAFMVLPIVLHKDTRESLPRTTRTSIPSWLLKHTEARIGFYERLMALKPHTREALRHGLDFDWIVMCESGHIRCMVTNNRINRAVRLLNGDAQECVSRGRFLGKWFGTIASTKTLMAFWGIRP